ncbi:MAG: Imm10 family immunity protein [Acidobacteriota bacterium]|nr:Imm10 family immunity protein [Acidobacteriota bacterium]
MRFELEATDTGYDEENDALTVGFGGLPDSEGFPTVYLTLQRSTDEGEDEPGIGGVYAEWCDQSMSCYGCIGGFDLYPNRARIKFTGGAEFYIPEGAGEGGGRLTELVVTFGLKDHEFRDLREKLSFIFQGCGCFTVHDVDAPASA